MKRVWIRLLAVVALAIFGMADTFHGPVFVAEPPTSVDFLNSTGVTIRCIANGRPFPSIQWILHDDRPVSNIPKLRHADSNGTLVFLPFRPEDYRQDVHATSYKCMATNPSGTIVSGNVRIRAVVNQLYEAQVYDDFVIKGNSAIMKCHIPSFVMDYVSVTSWIADDITNINSPIDSGTHYSLLPGGDLYIRNVQLDDQQTYRCRTVHKLTGEAKLSAMAGRLIVTVPQGSVPPRLANHKPSIVVEQGQTLILPCVAQGYPMPNYSWMKKVNKLQQIPLALDGRLQQTDGLLMIKNSQSQDSGIYVCIVNNSVGVERLETVVLVSEPLSVYLHPTHQTVQVGQSATFSCSVTGHPVHFIRWMKNGQLLKTEKVTYNKADVLRLPAVQKGDSGMVQCFAGNDVETVQSSAELKLGDNLPVVQMDFKGDPLQPGSDVSFLCTAYGNPSPSIEWSVDGRQLPVGRRFAVGGYESSVGDVIGFFNLSEVRTMDGGEYTCSARNRVGVASRSARLNIYGPPFIRPMERESAIAGRDILVKCLYGGFPIESIFWKKDGVLLPVDFRQEVYPNGTLIVRQAQHRFDSGQYTCHAKNKMGDEAHQQVEIQIMIPPMIDPSTFQGHDLHQGSHARIICGVIDGDLPINFTWLKDGEDVARSLGVVIRKIDEFSNVMTIKSVSTQHAGRYTCVARNAVASSNYSTELKVQVPPQWKVEPVDAKLVVGETVTIDCKADGFPRPRISWMKVIGNEPTGNRQELRNGSNVNIFGNGSLHIGRSHRADEGYFFCLANNGIGPGLSKMIYLRVRSPAKFDIRYRQQTARKGTDATLTCQAVGDAPLTFSWSKENHDLDLLSLPRYRIDDRKIPNGAISVLTIESAEREDSGIFQCKVKNEYGQDSASFHLMIIEPPESPGRVKVVDYGSRKVKLSWTQQYNGNSPVFKYQIEGKLASNDWNTPLLLLDTLSADTEAEIDGLSPATKYTFRVYSENNVGTSHPSESVTVVTEEEAPMGPPEDIQVLPIDAETLRVMWKPPLRHLWNGDLHGYNVGFRVADTVKPYLYKTLDVFSKSDSSLTVDLHGLKKFTKYSVVVRAFNRVGLGPLSDEVLQTTAEDVPSQPPQLVKCHALTSESLQITWEAPPAFGMNGILQGYKVIYQPLEERYEELNMETKVTSAVRTSLHGLKKYTNYSVQVLAFTQVGDGVQSDPLICQTLEDVPDPPAEIKALALSSDTILVTWRHPRNPNGILTKYSVYLRSVDPIKGATTIESLPATSNYYYARDIKEGAQYEFWVTASTAIGEGSSTPVVSQRGAGAMVSARVASFGQSVMVRQGDDMELPCLAVGMPPPKYQWHFRDHLLPLGSRHEARRNGSLVIRNVLSSDVGNYTCSINNGHSSDRVVYKVSVQEPPLSPEIILSTATSNTINVKWKVNAAMRIPIKGFLIHFKRDFGEWEEIPIPPEQQDYILENLECGTRYHVYISAKNDIGTGKPSQVTVIKTDGTAPIAPTKQKVLQESSTYVTLHLNAWKVGLECPILYFVVEQKPLHAQNWTLVSNNLQIQQGQFVIPELVPSTWYSLKMTAHNSAGSTVALYDFATLTITGGTVAPMIAKVESNESSSFDWNFYLYILLSVAAILAVIIMILLMACAIRNRKHRQTNSIHEEKPCKTASYTPYDIKKYKQDSTPTSFTYIMRHKDHPSSGSHQISDNSTKVSEDDICPYATFEIPPSKSRSFEDELNTFEEHSPDPHLDCIRDLHLDDMYTKEQKFALYNNRARIGYQAADGRFT